MSCEDTFNYLSNGPFCLVALDPRTGRAIKTNNRFTELIGPLFKFSEFDFTCVATEGPSRSNLVEAIDQARTSSDGAKSSVSARNIEILTLAGESGLPVKRHFDWTVGTGGGGQDLILFGNPVSEKDTEERKKDVELIDFFHNAPIALHWLSGEGIVMWANQTELDVLGYTAEEYIGQPIMNFCPDEEELVLEIFKQLGSGNSIKDVPVRFRTKDGRIVHLLIDSNVKYDDQTGNFSHTRCFIRDDTKRKIREAHTQTLLDETKRSLKMLDNFMSRSIHHMRNPLHVMQSTCELVTDILSKADILTQPMRESLALLHEAESIIESAVALADDLVQLNRLDQGAELEVKKGAIDLAVLGREVHNFAIKLTSAHGVSFALNVDGGSGPSTIHSDPVILSRVFHALLNHGMNVSKQGTVGFQIGYQNGLCTFSVVYNDTESKANAGQAITPGTLPPIFQRYHQELVPEVIEDLEMAKDLRETIEHHVSSSQNNCIGIGLSLAYHLVQALGSELRYSSQSGQAKFWFSLPKSVLPCTDACSLLSQVSLSHRPRSVSDAVPLVSPCSNSADEETCKRMRVDDVVENRGPSNHRILGDGPFEPLQFKEENSKRLKVEVPKASIAEHGLSSMDPPHVLIAEDTAMCAKLLRMTLTKFNCSTTWVENGRLAVEILRDSAPGTFQMCLMDLRMPEMDGLDATRIIKKELSHLNIPIIALTAETGEDIRKQCNAIGFEGFRQKPLKRDDLKKVLVQYTGYNVM